MKKKLKCSCNENGCVCDHSVEVFDYVPDNSVVVCADCSSGKHKKAKARPLKSTNMKETHKDMFVQTGG